MSATQRTIDRIPPQALQAEMAVLGAIMADHNCFDAIVDVLEPSDFYAHVHETIYQTLLHLYQADAPVDKITVLEALAQRGMLERVGGTAYLGALLDTVQTTASASYYATIVREKADLRTLIAAGTRVAEFGYTGEEDVAQAIDAAQRTVLDVGNRDRHRDGTPLSEAGRSLYQRLNSPHLHGLTTGLRGVDEQLGGLRANTSYVLAARPSMGKTSLAIGWALAAATVAAAERLGHVLVFSLEMSAEEVIGGAIAARASIDRRLLRDGGLRDWQWTQFHNAMTTLSALPLYVHTGCTIVDQVVARARRVRQRHGLALVVVDYLQLLSSTSKRAWSNRNEEVSDISRRLKVLATDLQVPVVILSQLNRMVEHRTEKRPTMADLRDSGGIEADADVIAFIHREVYYDSQADPYKAELIVAKQRTGPIGTIPLRFVPEFVRFEDPD